MIHLVMGKEEILKTLNDKRKNDGKLLLDFCKTPRAPGDLKNCRTKNDMIDILVVLKNGNAIAFENGKYITTPLGLETLAAIP